MKRDRDRITDVLYSVLAGATAGAIICSIIAHLHMSGLC